MFSGIYSNNNKTSTIVLSKCEIDLPKERHVEEKNFFLPINKKVDGDYSLDKNDDGIYRFILWQFLIGLK